MKLLGVFGRPLARTAIGLTGTAVALAAAALALFAAAPAGAVTIGAPLNQPPSTAEGCELLVLPLLRPTAGVPPSCTFFGFDANGAWASQTPRGQWVVTTARVRTGPRVGPMRFTMVRAMRSQATVDGKPAPSACCFSQAESQVFTPAPNTVNEIPVRMPAVNTVQMIDGEPVEVIDYLGISLMDLQSSAPLLAGPTLLSTPMAPALRAGQQTLGNGGFPGAPLINGEFQACAAAANASQASNLAGCPGGPGGGGPGRGGSGGSDGGDGRGGGGARFGIARQVPLLAGGTRARLTLNLPRAGVVRARSQARLPATRRGRPLLRPAAIRARRAGRARLTVGLTRTGRFALKRRGRLRVPVTINYRPRGATPSSQRRQIIFRRSARRG